MDLTEENILNLANLVYYLPSAYINIDIVDLL